jgi:hypothetical protein
MNTDGSPYLSAKGLGGDWNPIRIYVVQLVVCIGNERSGSTNQVSCNGQTYDVYSRTLDIYEATPSTASTSAGLSTATV